MRANKINPCFYIHCYNIGISRAFNMQIVSARPSEAALFQLGTKVSARVRDRHVKREVRSLINMDPSTKCIIYLVMYTRIINSSSLPDTRVVRHTEFIYASAPIFFRARRKTVWTSFHFEFHSASRASRPSVYIFFFMWYLISRYRHSES